MGHQDGPPGLPRRHGRSRLVSSRTIFGVFMRWLSALVLVLVSLVGSALAETPNPFAQTTEWDARESWSKAESSTRSSQTAHLPAAIGRVAKATGRGSETMISSR